MNIKSACYKFYEFANVPFTDQENAILPPNTELEDAEVPPINMIHYSSPLTSTDSASARTEHSCAVAAPEEINSHSRQAISCGEMCIWIPNICLIYDHICTPLSLSVSMTF
jgi:hypothetical protein